MQYVAWCRGNAGEILHHAFLKNLVICVFVRNIVISSLTNTYILLSWHLRFEERQAIQ